MALIAIDGDTRQRKIFDIARIAIQTPLLDNIKASLWVKVDEDVFPITVVEETPAPDDRIGEKRYESDGFSNTSLPPSISISAVPDSIGNDIVGEQLLVATTTSKVVVDNSNFKIGTNAMVAAIHKDTGDNDEVELAKGEKVESSRDLLCEIDSGEKSIKHYFEMVKKAYNRGAFSVGDSNLILFGPERRQYVGFPSKAQARDYSRIENTGGPENRLELLETIDEIWMVAVWSKSPAIGLTLPNIARSKGKSSKKRQLDNILQLRLSKRVIGKGNKSKNLGRYRNKKEAHGDCKRKP
ncbi:hypothetical protein Ancab_022957 [Ancistrocladus abbreviatus]